VARYRISPGFQLLGPGLSGSSVVPKKVTASHRAAKRCLPYIRCQLFN